MNNKCIRRSRLIQSLIRFLILIAFGLVTVLRAQTNLAVFTWAGLAGAHGVNDGVGTNASFYYPCGVALDRAGNLYLADAENQIVREINTAGVVTTLAGSPGSAGTNDGSGDLARFDGPQSVAINADGTVMFVADTANTIRKMVITGTNWVVSTFAGSAGITGTNDGNGSAARFNDPRCVALATNGDIYVADANNATIRKVTASGMVTTLAGYGGKTGTNDATGSAARFNQPRYLAVDDATNVYVADWNNFTVRRISSAGVVTTLAGLAGTSGTNDGTGSAARFYSPRGVSVDKTGNVYVADYWNCTIRKITATGIVTTIAGRPGVSGSADGYYTNATFLDPFTVLIDSTGTALYIVDNNNQTIRKGIFDYGQPFVAKEPRLTTVLYETNLTLAPAVANATPSSYQWIFNGTNLPEATNASLTITNVQFAAEGNYGVILNNGKGASTNAIDTVQVVPLVITSQPQDAAGMVGADLQFTVGVASFLPLTYQWYFGSMRIANGTNVSLPVSDVQTTDAGYYQVSISTAYGSATSLPAALDVLGVPVLFATNGEGIQWNNGLPTLKVAGLTGQGSVIIQTSTNLANWNPIFTNPAAFGAFQYLDTQATNFGRRFYRAITPAAP